MKELKVELGGVTSANVQQLKIINSTTLPVRYSDKFYNDILLEPESKILKFAFYNGFAVGAVCTRIEQHEIEGCFKLYIMTINVLAAYRRRGIATTLLKYALDEAAKNPAIIEAYLHVQTSNADAKNFYLSHGFVEVETVLDYYRNIDPPHSFLLKRSLKEGHSIDGKSAESDTRPQDADQIDNTTAIVN